MTLRWLAPFVLLASCAKVPAPPAASTALPAGTPSSSWILLVFGANDHDPADWSGSLEPVGAGRISSLVPGRFDRDDKVTGANSWKCETRLTAVADPRDWFVGALHVVPQDMAAKPRGTLIPNTLYAAVEGAPSLRLKTAHGEASFGVPAFGTVERVLGGRVAVQRVPAPATVASDREDDDPAIVAGPGGRAVTAWISYRNEKERLIVDGQTLAEGEYFRPHLSSSANGTLALVVSVHTNDTWRIGAAFKPPQGPWSPLDLISTGGPDLQPRGVFDSRGRFWIAWQGYREGRSRIVARTRETNGRWGAETVVSENTANAWEPSLAADAKGGVHFVWDAYDAGNYDVFYKQPGAGAQRAITTSALREARASVAIDKLGRPWIAWDEGGANWGKDTGFLVPANNGATRLYQSRRLRVAVLTADGLREAPSPPGSLEYPRLSSDGNGRLWLLALTREVKPHPVFSPSLQRDRIQTYSFWGAAATWLTDAGWAQLVPFPQSWGRNDPRAALAPLPGGRAAVAWSGDGRSYPKTFPPGKNTIYSGVIEGAGVAGAARLGPLPAPPAAGPVHASEARDIEALHQARIQQLRILRGDMHRHTDLSFDGDIDGSLWDFYRYTIDAAGFDYSAVTDHNSGDDNEYIWWIIQKSNDLYHWPGRFTPLYAYERSLRFPNGHRNLVWAKRGVRTLVRSPEEEAGTEGAARLYEYLRKTGGLAMSHTSATLMGTDWRDNDPKLEPLVEIYQGDRTSYEHEGAPRAATAKDPFSQPGGFKPEGFVWKAWEKGYKLGVQASSDHASTHISYAVLLAEDTTREGILKAIAARHAYGATDNILLDFRAGGHIQGDVFTTASRPRLSLRARGTAPVAKLDLIRSNRYLVSTSPNRPDVDFEFEDTSAPSGESWYYVRITQADGQMAWSSPIWITYAPRTAALR